jgi:hypothetical protein
MPRKWKTDRLTEAPKPWRRYWLTVNDGEDHYVMSATFDGVEWRDLCGLHEGFEALDLPRMILAWMPQPETPEPWTPSAVEEGSE